MGRKRWRENRKKGKKTAGLDREAGKMRRVGMVVGWFDRRMLGKTDTLPGSTMVPGECFRLITKGLVDG